MKKALIFLFIILPLSFLVGCDMGGEEPAQPKEGKTPTIDFVMSEYFADNMVIQQKEKFAITGKSEEGVLIKAALYDSKGYVVNQSSDVCDIDGNFEIALSAPKGSFEEYKIVVTDTVNTHEIDHILFGEVWLFAGEATIKEDFSDIEIEEKNIRFFKYINNELTWVDAKDKNLYSVTVQIANALSNNLKVPVGFIDATLDEVHADAYLDKELATKYKFINNYLKSIERDDFGSNTKLNVDITGSMYDTYHEILSHIVISGLIWNQGISDFKDFTTGMETKSGQYGYLAVQLLSNLKVYNDKQFDIYVLQEPYNVAKFANELRNTQAAIAYQLNNTSIIPTYDLYDIEIDEEENETFELNVDDYINRLLNTITNTTYSKKKNYVAPTYVNVVANKTDVTITFNSYHTLVEVEEIYGLTIVDANGEEIPFTFDIHNNFIDLVLEFTEEQLEEDLNYVISYAQNDDIYKCNLKSESGIPVLPFIININE